MKKGSKYRYYPSQQKNYSCASKLGGKGLSLVIDFKVNGFTGVWFLGGFVGDLKVTEKVDLCPKSCC